MAYCFFLFKISLTINKNIKARGARKVRVMAAMRPLQKKVRAKAAEKRKVCVKGAKRPSCVCEGRRETPRRACEGCSAAKSVREDAKRLKCGDHEAAKSVREVHVTGA